MTELDAALVQRKLAVIRRNLDDLAAIDSLSLEEYRADRFRLKGVERLAPAAGLRNRLVHEYDEIDDAVVLQAVVEARRTFREYVSALENYLARQGF